MTCVDGRAARRRPRPRSVARRPGAARRAAVPAVLSRAVRLGNLARADHHLGHARRRRDRRRAPSPARRPRRSTVTSSAKRHHLAELVRDHQHGDRARARHAPSACPSTSSASAGVSTEVGSSRIMKRRSQVELLQDLDLLLLAGGEARRPARRAATRNGIVSMKAASRSRSRRQRTTRGHVVARHHQVLGHRHARHQREVLVDHADAERVRVVRRADVALAPAHHDLPGVGPVDSRSGTSPACSCRRRSRRAARGTSPAGTCSDTSSSAVNGAEALGHAERPRRRARPRGRARLTRISPLATARR